MFAYVLPACGCAYLACRVGQNCMFTPYVAVYLVISLPLILYIHRIHMVQANPTCLPVGAWIGKHLALPLVPAYPGSQVCQLN
jgi:hypothetical protein